MGSLGGTGTGFHDPRCWACRVHEVVLSVADPRTSGRGFSGSMRRYCRHCRNEDRNAQPARYFGLRRKPWIRCLNLRVTSNVSQRSRPAGRVSHRARCNVCPGAVLFCHRLFCIVGGTAASRHTLMKVADRGNTTSFCPLREATPSAMLPGQAPFAPPQDHGFCRERGGSARLRKMAWTGEWHG